MFFVTATSAEESTINQKERTHAKTRRRKGKNRQIRELRDFAALRETPVVPLCESHERDRLVTFQETSVPVFSESAVKTLIVANDQIRED